MAPAEHPDERYLPGYIQALTYSGSVKQLARWLRDTYPASFNTLQPQLSARLRELQKKESLK